MFKNKTIWIVIAVAAVLLFWVKGVYNNMVTQDEGVKTAWSQVEKPIPAPLGLDPELSEYRQGLRFARERNLGGCDTGPSTGHTDDD